MSPGKVPFRSANPSADPSADSAADSGWHFPGDNLPKISNGSNGKIQLSHLRFRVNRHRGNASPSGLQWIRGRTNKWRYLARQRIGSDSAREDYGAKTGGFLQSCKRLRAIGRELVVKLRQAEVGAAASPLLVINILIFCVYSRGVWLLHALRGAPSFTYGT